MSNSKIQKSLRDSISWQSVLKNFLLIILVALLVMANIAIAQEVRPDQPPMDDDVREQTEQRGSTISSDIIHHFNELQEEAETIIQEATDSGKIEGERFQSVLEDYKNQASLVQQRINEAEAGGEIGQGTEDYIAEQLNELDSYVQELRNELMTTEPGKPPGKKPRK